jgi:hypothetical protein
VVRVLAAEIIEAAVAASVRETDRLSMIGLRPYGSNPA